MKVVVYLPAKDERDLAAAGHDPATWVRETVKEALKDGSRSADDRIVSSAKPLVSQDTPEGRRHKQNAEVMREAVLSEPLTAPRGIVCTAPVGTKCKIHGKVCNPRGAE